ncbi:MAG TPA: hypothetical protein VG944_22555, partial [Fimbriimonas sp.]|nr:hypothetical protein [Fimbriimonas sp.]
AVVDNEVGHAVNLGFAAPPNYIDSFVEALEPFKNLPDTSQSSQQRVGLDLSAAIVAKQDASARFVGKVATLLSAYKARVQGVSELLGERIKHAVSHDESVVRPILESFRGEVEQMHLIRIDEVATDLQLAGSNSGDVNLISNYVDLYIEFVILKLTEGAAQINDYIDLQFFAYLDLGYVFASKENKWKELAERTKKSNGFISVDN